MTNHVVLAGGSGFLGQSLARYFAAKDIPSIILTRSETPRDGFVHWDGATVGDWADHLNGARAVINLTGRSVDCRHTAENRREIMDSRVNSVRALGEALRQSQNPPPVWVQAGSLAIYGDSGDYICDEEAPHGSGFTVEVCQRWEEELARQVPESMRYVNLRIGFVLDKEDGALGKLASLTRWFLGGTVGSGKQYISWLHIDDMNRIFEWCVDNKNASGIYNATGPNPVTNATFMSTLRSALHRPWSPPTPSLAVRLGTYFMGTEASLALTGRRCVPSRLLAEAFTFHHTILDSCLRKIFDGDGKAIDGTVN